MRSMLSTVDELDSNLVALQDGGYEVIQLVPCPRSLAEDAECKITYMNVEIAIIYFEDVPDSNVSTNSSAANSDL